jgi:hypothetical protein
MLGMPRVAEVKTIRRKLDEIALKKNNGGQTHVVARGQRTGG